MSISEIGSIGELLGAVATGVTLVYVASQIRGKTSWTKRHAWVNTIDRIVDWGAKLNANTELHEIYREGKAGFADFDDEKKHRYHLVLAEILVACEAVHEHSKTRSIKSESIDAIDKRILRELDGAGALTWCRELGRDFFAIDFVEDVEKLLAR